METQKNYYSVLGVSQTSEHVVIQAAYRALMRKYHPDTAQDTGVASEQRAKEINEAYAVLSDLAARVRYDAMLNCEQHENTSHTPRQKDASMAAKSQDYSDTAKPSRENNPISKLCADFVRSKRSALNGSGIGLASIFVFGLIRAAIQFSHSEHAINSNPNAETLDTINKLSAEMPLAPTQDQPTPSDGGYASVIEPTSAAKQSVDPMTAGTKALARSDFGSAVDSFRVAARSGNPEAMARLAGMYGLGSGVSIDLLRVHMWLILAARTSPSDQNRQEVVHSDEMWYTPQQLAQSELLANRCQYSGFFDC